MRISLALAAMAMAGVGAMKTYGAYTAANMSDSDLLLAENVEALSSCEITKKGKVVLRCTGDNRCSTTYLGYTLTCDGTKVAN